MDWLLVASTVSRWLHVLCACIVVGGIFWMVLAPSAAPRGRAFKPVLHGSILLLILTGSFNAWRAWGQYNLWPGVLHGVFGMHLIVALAAIVLVIVATARPIFNGKLLAWGVALLFVVVLLASTLKGLRERAVLKHSTPITSHA
ncbi:MAG: hypothetical protein IT447_16105 [Phycisphaerales bacterium]|jgi:uncharacterized membrane protein|nr:hypothetical protein [Phycisphaerales bacterium]